MMKKNFIILLIFIAVVIIGLSIFLIKQSRQFVSPEIEKLALCLKEKEAVMYGTYWCPHCNRQKEMFSSFFKYINYVECTEKPEECNKIGISGVPTWIFKDGTRLEGVQSLERLKEVAGCQ